MIRRSKQLVKKIEQDLSTLLSLEELYNKFTVILSKYDNEVLLDVTDLRVLSNTIKDYKRLLKKVSLDGLKAMLPHRVSEYENKLEIWADDLEYFEWIVGKNELWLALEVRLDHTVEFINNVLGLYAMNNPMHAGDVINMFSYFSNINNLPIYRTQLRNMISGSISKPAMKRLYDAYNIHKEIMLKRRRAVNESDNPAFNEYNASKKLYESYFSRRGYGGDEDLDVELHTNFILDVYLDDRTSRSNKIEYSHEYKTVYAVESFARNDVIEVAPVQVIPNKDLFSRELRDVVVELIPGKYYGIVFGYVNSYKVADRFSGRKPNATYSFDSQTRTINVISTQTIKSGEEIILEDKTHQITNVYEHPNN